MGLYIAVAKAVFGGNNMRDAQKPDHRSLNTIIIHLREGRYVIPDFQREFEWKPWDIRDLLRSIFLDYYIGSLLLWKGTKENFEALSCERIYGFRGNGHPDTSCSMVITAIIGGKQQHQHYALQPITRILGSN
jgi:uncharacterized protein DUF262